LFENKEFFKELTTMIDNNQVVSFPVKGTSMLPFLKNGLTEVFLQKSTTYKKRDICLFEYKGKTLLHRIIKIHNNQYTFQGDHSYNIEVVDESNIIAKVNYYITSNKTIQPNSSWIALKVRLFLLFKQIKRIARRILKGKRI